jgi:uncharacterized DUF497 family protein
MAMRFEWSEAKRLKVLEERGLDFIDARALFDGRPVVTAPSPRDAEERSLTIGELDGHMVAVVWCWRDQVVRIITMRKARDAEKSRYRSLLG